MFPENCRLPLACSCSTEPNAKTTRGMGATLASGVGEEDTDLALTAFDLGLGTGLFRCLILTHLIPAGRVKEDYLLRLVEAKGFSYTMLQSARSMRDSFRKHSPMGRFLQWYRRMRERSPGRSFRCRLVAGV